jgi:hypothetical protein
MTATAATPVQPLEQQGLAPASGPRGKTLFTVVPPAQTGIVVENKYDDPRMWGDHFEEFAYGASGTGVAIGDYDNDGRPDVFVVSKTEGGHLSVISAAGNSKT